MTVDPSFPPPSADPAAPGGFEPAGIARRMGALLVDWMLCVLLSAAFVDPFRSSWQPVAVLIAEYGFFIGVFGQTPGMVLTRLRCISVADGGAIGVPRALLRGVLLALIVPTLIMDEWRRGLHDKAAGSIVVAIPPKTTANSGPTIPGRPA